MSLTMRRYSSGTVSKPAAVHPAPLYRSPRPPASASCCSADPQPPIGADRAPVAARLRRRRRPPAGAGANAISAAAPGTSTGATPDSLTDCRCVSRSSSLMTSGRKSLPDRSGLLPQHLQVVLERMGAALDRRQPQRRRLSLDRVRLPEQRIELLAERALLARRLAQHRVDHLHRRIRVAQERGEMHRDRCAECRAAYRPAPAPGCCELCSSRASSTRELTSDTDTSTCVILPSTRTRWNSKSR